MFNIQIISVPRNVIRKKEVAIVTGGSRGIGYEVVKGLVTAGYHVIVASRNELEAEEAIVVLKKEHPGAHGKGLCIIMYLHYQFRLIIGLF